MVWANALVLGLGGLLVAAPVILHFLMQPKPKEHVFPALKFLRERQLTNRSRMRMQHILLLLLRCLLILLMAAALAGPTVAAGAFANYVTLGLVGISALVIGIAFAAAMFVAKKRNGLLIGILGLLLLGHLLYGGYAAYKLANSESGQLLGDSRDPVSALLIIDSSCRMSYTQDSKDSLAKAKEISSWLLEQFPSDSQVAVLATDGEPAFFSVDVGAARNRAESVEINYKGAFLPETIAAGMELFDQAIYERKEIYVLTDMTRRSWTGSDSQNILKKLENDLAISVFVFDVGQKEYQNFSLAPLRLGSEAIADGGQLELSTTIDRVGAAAQRALRLVIEKPDNSRPVIRDKQVLVPDKFWERTQTVDIRENSNANVSFQFSQKLPRGVHHGRVEIVGDDSLVVDDVRYFSIEVRDAWKVAVVCPADVNPNNYSFAVSPPRDQIIGNSLYEVTIIDQAKLSSVKLDAFQAVVLLDPEPVSDAMWVRLEQYVAQGHGLGVFLGRNALNNGVADLSFTSLAAQKLLTGTLTRPWERDRDNPDLFLSPDNLSHEIFAPFRSWEEAVAWNDFPIHAYWGMEPQEDTEGVTTQTILKYGNGHPAIINRLINNGRVLVMTTSLTESSSDRAWNDLFVGYSLPAWLLVREITNYLVQSQADHLNLSIGQTATLQNDVRKFPESYRIFTPRTKGAPAKVTTVGDQIRYRFTETPGTYRIKGDRSGPVLRGFSVNLNEAETDLTRIMPAEVDEVLGAGRYQLATEKDEIQRQQGTSRRGQEFYPLLVLLVAVIMGVEYIMANKFYS